MPIAKFQDYLVGDHAFYKQHSYVHQTVQDFTDPAHLKEPVYRHEIDSKIVRVVKDIFAVVFFPLAFYRLVHFVVGKLAILPASNPASMGLPADTAHGFRKVVNILSPEWKYKRLTLEVEGYAIDAAIMGRVKANGTSTFENKRWVLKSEGNGGFYEATLAYDHSWRSLLTHLDANAIVFNYPGVGASSGLPSKRAMTKAYQAVLRFLEDQENGIGAKQIIGIGHSIGGGVQGEALKSHRLKKGIDYVFVKSRTFSCLSAEAAYLIKSRFIGFLIKVFNWELDSVESSKKLDCPEIVIQTAAVREYTDLVKIPSRLIDDGIIGAECSLASVLLTDPTCSKERKYFMGVPDDHNADLSRPDLLAQKIEEFLQPAYQVRSAPAA